MLVMVALCCAMETPSPDPLASLRAGHPRLIVEAADWGKIRDRAAADPEFRPLVVAALACARELTKAPPPTRTLEGRRLLSVSRRVLTDAVWLSFAYRLTGDRIFLEAAERNLLAAAGFEDWNPSHFLDVAEMTAALAIGYDWLASDLSAETRNCLRTAIVTHGLKPGLDREAKHNWWQKRENNWNQICLGGLTLGALAIADEEPDLARRVLDLLAVSHPHGLVPYAPDGIYPEGPGYWRYGTGYTVLTLAALRTALGSEFPFKDLAPFESSAGVQALLMAPSGQPYTFADMNTGTSADPLLFWFAKRLDDPALLAGQRRYFLPFVPPSAPGKFAYENLFAILDWQLPPAASRTGWTAWHGNGPVPLAVFRGPDTPGGAFYLALKGGAASDNHAHMDGGSFVLEIDGVRWVHDLGMQNYNALETRGIKLFEGRPGGDRWRVFRYTNFAHSTLTIDARLHEADGRVTLRDFSPPPAMGITADLTPALGPGVSKALRRFAPDPDGLGLTLTDTLSGVAPGAEILWTLVTRGKITLAGSTATIEQSGRKLEVRVESPQGAVFTTAPAGGPAEFDAPAPDHQLLCVLTNAPAGGELRLKVAFRLLPEEPSAR